MARASIHSQLRVVDLFCGPGGISEGLRQAGFATVYALDKDRAAVETFRRNHPEALVERVDVTDLDPGALPDFDVLVGGPPCVEFSASKGSRGNILEGLRLVQAFLRVAYERQPRYWIMENVPRIVLHLPEEIPLRWIGIDKPGTLHVPVRAEFNCADFGAPQTRRRFLLGNFPLPVATHAEPATVDDLFVAEPHKPRWHTLGDVLRALGSPLARHRPHVVVDPNYGFRLPVASLTDHNHDVLMSEREGRQIKKAKVAHPYMGVMPFPDSPDRPARTVVATQLGRETLVIADCFDGRPVVRRATVRECATLQTFPITYQFCGGTLGTKYRLAGDAVPPLLAYAIGSEIRRLEGMPVLEPDVRRTPLFLAEQVNRADKPRIRCAFPETRKFAELVPGKEVRGTRVELDNLGLQHALLQLVDRRVRHPVQWSARLYVGEGRKLMKSRAFTVDEALREMGGFARSSDANAQWTIAFLRDAEATLPLILPDASTLQAVWTRRHDYPFGPEEVTDALAALVDRHFPSVAFRDRFVPPCGQFDLIPRRGLRVRLAAALLVTAYAAELINVGEEWVSENVDARYLPAGVMAKPEGRSPRSTIPPSERLLLALRQPNLLLETA